MRNWIQRSKLKRRKTPRFSRLLRQLARKQGALAYSANSEPRKKTATAA